MLRRIPRAFPSSLSFSSRRFYAVEAVEEPLALSVHDGYGFCRINSGDALGPSRQFAVQRKLGWGMYSSTWLARDQTAEKDVAIKVLTGFATQLVNEGITPELDVLRKLTTVSPAAGHCLSLHSNFVHPGQVDTGPHLCLVTDVFGGDVEHLKRAIARNGFPLSLAKRILLHTLKGLATMHKQGIVHTDLKHDNILFDRGSSDWTSIPAKEPLPIPSVPELLDRTFVISDFGNAQFIGDPTADEITAEALRAPETLLRGPWDEKVDIWTFGCLVFEFLSGRQLFKRRSFSEHSLDTVGGHLWRMMCFTDEKFEPEQLEVSGLSSTYFDGSCQLKSRPPHFSHPILKILTNFGVLDQDQLQKTSAFMQRCLRLDPKNRATAEELLEDPFWEGVSA